MLFSYHWLNKYLAYNISPEQIADLLTMHAFEVERVDKKGDDHLLEIVVLPNRASDALCHRGMAREINALAKFKGGFAQKEAESDGDLNEASEWLKGLPILKDFTVKVEQDCALYYALKITGVTVAHSPEWLANELAAIGQDSINNLVDISNYVMFDMQQPTHMFDASTLGGNMIQVRKAHQKEGIELLGGTTVILSPQDLVIADVKKAVAIAGIKGSKHSGVSQTTSDIIVEVANFNPATVYTTASSLHITTESGKRFSAGLAYETAVIALYRTATLIQEIAGGEIVGIAVYESKEVHAKRPPVFLDSKKLANIGGVIIPDEVIINALSSLGFASTKESETIIKLQAPFWRLDCTIPEDIAEEVIRFYGLDAIKPISPSVQLGKVVYEDAQRWRAFVRRYLSSQGFDEMYNYSFMPSSRDEQRNVKLKNPISEDKAFLRDNLIDGLLRNIEQNQGLFADMKLFEIGNVFWQEERVVYEEEHIAGVVFHKKQGDFREIRGYMEGLLEAAGFDGDDYLLQPGSRPGNPFLELSIRGKECGTIQIPTLPAGIKIKGHFFAFELRADMFYSFITNEREFQAPPRFPAVIRDISVVLPKEVKGDSVVQIIHELGKDLIEDVDLFDVYEESNTAGKSLAFHIIYRSAKKTLTDKEINPLHKAIEQEIITRLHGQIR